MPELLVTLVAALGGVALGAFLGRRNERRATSERLLTEALNDIVGGISDAANQIPGAQARYASGMARLALHGDSDLTNSFRVWQGVANTGTAEGKSALVEAVQQARRSMGREELTDDVLYVLLFGSRSTGSSERGPATAT